MCFGELRDTSPQLSEARPKGLGSTWVYQRNQSATSASAGQGLASEERTHSRHSAPEFHLQRGRTPECRRQASAEQSDAYARALTRKTFAVLRSLMTTHEDTPVSIPGEGYVPALRLRPSGAEAVSGLAFPRCRRMELGLRCAWGGRRRRQFPCLPLKPPEAQPTLLSR